MPILQLVIRLYLTECRLAEFAPNILWESEENIILAQLDTHNPTCRTNQLNYCY